MLVTNTEQKKCYIQTFGCQMNEHDSLRMLQVLKREGYCETSDIDQADLILMNTCSVRENPENKVYSLLGHIRKKKNKNHDLIIGVGGCVAQQEGKKILQRERCVDMVFGTDNFFKLPEMLKKVSQGERVLETKWMPRDEKVQNFIPKEEIKGGVIEGVKAYVSITKGCDNFCTFCIVPMTRGRLVSREKENILEECRALVDRGAQEICLLGQNVNSYEAKGVDFLNLLESVADVPGVYRVRFTSPYPNDWTRELSDLMNRHPHISNYLHLPFQSGSDRILFEMKRGHTRKEYLEKVAYMRKINPGLELTADLIVGFPGETEEDFLDTLDILEKVKFAQVYAFKYSQRPNTVASRLDDDVPQQVKEERLARVFELQNRLSCEVLDSYVGREEILLLDGFHPKEKGVINGRTDSYRPVSIEADHLDIGDWVKVRITDRRTHSLRGKFLAKVDPASLSFS